MGVWRGRGSREKVGRNRVPPASRQAAWPDRSPAGAHDDAAASALLQTTGSSSGSSRQLVHDAARFVLDQSATPNTTTGNASLAPMARSSPSGVP